MMIRSVADIVSSRVELQPGDVIATGTAEGAGIFQDIQLYPDDRAEIEVEEIRTLLNTVEEADE